MSKLPVYTPARPAHIEGILKLTLKAFEEGPEAGLPVNRAKMRGMVDFLVRDDHQLAVVATVGGTPKGVILGHVDSHAYCDGLVASDICIYVAKSLRGTDCAKELVRIYADWCGRIPNLVGSTLGISKINHTTPYMEKLFRDNGYHRTGLNYIRLAERHV